MHDKLITLGFTHTHYKASYEDVGTGETGPKVIGGPAFDEYLHKATHLKVIIIGGKVEYFGDADPMDFAINTDGSSV